MAQRRLERSVAVTPPADEGVFDRGVRAPLDRVQGDANGFVRSRPATGPGALPARTLYVRAFLRALRDPTTYAARRNLGLWMGFALALPIPVLALAGSAPTWGVVLALSAPIAWAAILGAAGRVARLADDELHRVTSEASTAGREHAAERVVWSAGVDLDRTERERLESLHRLMNAELVLAETVNRSLLPEGIVRPDLEVVVRQVPCLHVGGDYLHAALPRPDLLYLCVGDVSGHGVSASLVVSRIHGLVQRAVLEQREPGQILEDINGAMVRILEFTSFFMTFAVFRVDLAAQRIDYAMAGHPAQLLLESGGTLRALTSGNGILGLRDPSVLGPRKQLSLSYMPGDMLILYTDGLFEVLPNRGGEMLGESGLLEGLGSLAGSTPTVVVSEILRKVTEFGRPGPFLDDVSLMVARLGRCEGGGSGQGPEQARAVSDRREAAREISPIAFFNASTASL